MTTPIVSVQDGPRMTVSMMVKSPTLIPKRLLSMHDQEFLVDAVLRKASDAPSGQVMFFESTPMFSADDPTILDEFAEIPTTHGSVGTPKIARVVRRAFGLRVSKTMIDRNNVDAVNIQLVQIRNTMVRAWEDAFFSLLAASTSVQSVTTSAAWSAATTHIRGDINAAKFLIKMAAADTDGKQKFGYEADTLIISTETEQDFLDNDEVNSVYLGNIASEGVRYKGTLPNKFNGLDVMTSWRMSEYFPHAALVCQRKTLGGISDERPLQATPLYPLGGGGNGGPTEAFRTDLTRASALFLDQPKAAVVIHGVQTGSETYPEGVTID